MRISFQLMKPQACSASAVAGAGKRSERSDGRREVRTGEGERERERTSSEGKGLLDPNGQVGLACLQLS